MEKLIEEVFEGNATLEVRQVLRIIYKLIINLKWHTLKNN